VIAAIAGLALLVLTAAPLDAVEPDEVLADPALEQRAREISQGLRCVVCQNQSIDDSDAELARDLRLLVRERLQAGDSDVAVVDYVVSRYGDFVLLAPPMRIGTYALWFGPAVIVAAGAAGVLWYFRGRRGAGTDTAPLTTDEERRVAEALSDDAR
jgi:cytochrome c-type biogenesis protein CcmH